MRNAAIILGAFLLVVTAGCGGKSHVSAVSVGGNDDAGPPQAQAQVEPQLRAELAAELERVLRLYPPRAVSAPPSSGASATVLSWDEEQGSFHWRYYSAGDYDQNGLVGVSDLTPLGVHFGKSSGGGPFDQATVESVVDGDGNGLIGISDITPIGQNFGLVCDGYRLFYSNAEADVPGEAAEPNGPGAELVAEVIFSDATGEAAERKSCSYAPAETPPEGYYWVRPYDGEQLGTPSNAWLLGAANQPPIAVLRAAPTSGLIPLTVELIGIFSADLDGEIVKYEWDFDGPINGEKWLDTGDEGFAEHTYESAGNYLATMRVTDDLGDTDTAAELIRVHDPIPPIAELDYIQENLGTPSHVQYDASGSRDTDGLIVRYEWDFDADDVFEYDGGAEPTADFFYWASGLYETTVRVTDDDGLVNSASVTAAVAEHEKWRQTTVLTSVVDMLQNLGGSIGGESAVADVGGRPAVAYSVGLPDDADIGPGYGGDDRIEYIVAQDNRGAAWHSPVIVEPGNVPGTDYKSETLHLGVVEGRPVILFRWEVLVPIGGPDPPFEQHNGVDYMRAQDADGVNWPEPTKIDDDIYLYSPMMLVGQHPAFYSSNALYRAADALGLYWGSSSHCGPPSIYGGESCFGVANGNPAFTTYYPSGESVLYKRAVDATGSSWPETPTVVADRPGRSPQMVIAGGHPAVAYYDSLLNRIMYCRALDPNGESWPSPRMIRAWTRGRQSMTLIDGRPAVLYGDSFTREVMFVAANDTDGASWGFPMAIETVGTASESRDAAYQSSLGEIAGAPCFTYSYSVTTASIKYYYLRYVTYY